MQRAAEAEAEGRKRMDQQALVMQAHADKLIALRYWADDIEGRGRDGDLR